MAKEGWEKMSLAHCNALNMCVDVRSVHIPGASSCAVLKEHFNVQNVLTL